MNLERSIPAFAILCLLTFMVAKPINAQMEKRKNALYQQKAFVESCPTIGQHVPELQLRTIEGDSVDLAETYKGKNIVLIKAGYT
jgi:hypothetical protein